MTFKDELQSRVSRWVSIVIELQAERIECCNIGEEFTKSRILSEYKGRIYAARQITGLLGIEIDSDF